MHVMSVPPLRLLLPALAAVVLAGCGTTQSCGGNQDYLTAQERPRLDLPPGVMTSEREAPVVIPPAAPDPQKLDPQPRCLDFPPPFFAPRKPAPSVAPASAPASSRQAPQPSRNRPDRPDRAEPGLPHGRIATVRNTSLLSGISLAPGTLRAVLLDRLTRSLGKHPDTATQRDIYDALSLAVREELAARWLATQRRVSQAGVKRVCYLSVEFLLGRSLHQRPRRASTATWCRKRARRCRARLRPRPRRAGRDRPGPRQRRPRPARRVLPRFARDAAVPGRRLRHPLRLRHLHAGHRRGRPAARDREQLAAPAQPVGDPARRRALRGPLRRPLHRHAGRAGPHALPLGRHAEHLGRRLRPAHPGQPQPDGQSPAAVGRPRHRAVQRRGVQRRPPRRGLGRGQVDAKNVSRILYPDDTTPQGKELRFKQQYFFVSASLQDMLAQHLAEGRALESLPDAHRDPAQRHAPGARDPRADAPAGRRARAGVGARLGHHAARVLATPTTRCCPRRSRSGRSRSSSGILPRHLQIIYLINRALLDEVSARYPNDHERRQRMSLIDEGHGRQVRMAHLAVVASHTVNGVAKLHSELMTQTIFSDFAELYPDRFTNVTNGIAVRRWLKQSNPGLSALLTERLGHAWENDLEELERLRWAADDAGVPRALPRRSSSTTSDGSPTTIQRRVGIEVDVGLAVRRAGEAHPRVQAAAAEPAVRDHALPPHPRQSRWRTSCRAP